MPRPRGLECCPSSQPNFLLIPGKSLCGRARPYRAIRLAVSPVTHCTILAVIGESSAQQGDTAICCSSPATHTQPRPPAASSHSDWLSAHALQPAVLFPAPPYRLCLSVAQGGAAGVRRDLVAAVRGTVISRYIAVRAVSCTDTDSKSGTKCKRK
ncbi:Hypothetical predicted protein [Pelobates cultripes]|uniref:Uncharacterized protein n=1 Tax=Pelobates cultripes TaxID=61616 RepID=A0AAD1RV03_PELCU|nr:Hypothetical predicted protein [Pelobates cultripes]